MVTLRRQSALIIWGLFTIGTIGFAVFTSIVLTRPHYVGFSLFGIAWLVQLLRAPFCYLLTLVLLIVGFFVPASFTPSVMFLNIGTLSLGWPYLLLIVYFLIVNSADLPDWAAYIFAKEE